MEILSRASVQKTKLMRSMLLHTLIILKLLISEKTLEQEKLRGKRRKGHTRTSNGTLLFRVARSKVKDKRTWLLRERIRTDHNWSEAWQSKSYSMSLLPTHQRVCEHRRYRVVPKMKVTGPHIRRLRIWGRILQWEGRERQWLCFQRSVWDNSVHIRWDVSINIDVTCLHIVHLVWLFVVAGIEERGGGGVNTVCFKEGSRKCSVVATKIRRPPLPHPRQ